jgi:hypothetical protein
MSYFIRTLGKTPEDIAKQDAAHKDDLYRLEVYTAALKLVGPFYEALHTGKKKGFKFSFGGQGSEFTQHVTTVANDIAAIWETSAQPVTKPVEAPTGMPDLPSPVDSTTTMSSWREGFSKDGIVEIAPLRGQ